jgi:hypothetical protein
VAAALHFCSLIHCTKQLFNNQVFTLCPSGGWHIARRCSNDGAHSLRLADALYSSYRLLLVIHEARSVRQMNVALLLCFWVEVCVTVTAAPSLQPGS